MRRHGITSALLLCAALLLSACSLLPQQGGSPSRDDRDDEDETSETVEFSARDLEELFDADDAPSDLDIDMDFSTTDGDDWADEIAGYWDNSEGSEIDCFDSYAASFLLGGSDDDEHAKIALSGSASDYLSVDARVFPDSDDAEDYFDVVEDASEKCSDAGGYELFSEGELIWSIAGVDVFDADELDLPEGVSGIIQQEDVAPDFADSYRVIMLQRANVIVAITVQPAMDGEFDPGDGDELAELIAENLADFD